MRDAEAGSAPPSWRRHAPFLLALIIVPAAWLAPVLVDPFHRVAGPEGDNLFYIRQLWWMKHALLDLHRSPFFDPGSYFPIGYALSRTEVTPVNSLPAVPVTAIAGPVFAYNLMVLLSFVLTGLTTYLWIYRVTRRRGAALTAGLIVTLGAYRTAHTAGHLPLITTQWIPLLLWSFEEFLERRSAKWSIAMGVSAALVALSSWYYAYAMALMFPVYAVARTWNERRVWLTIDWWTRLVPAALAWLILVTPFAIPYVVSAMSGGMERTFTELQSWSLNFYAFFIPNAAHVIWGPRIRDAFPQEGLQWVERGVSLGLIATVLTAVAVWRRKQLALPAVTAMIGVWVASYLIALGPYVYSGDHQVFVPVPWIVSKTVDWYFAHFVPDSPLRAEYWARQALPIPLPSLLLVHYVPGTASMRVMARFGVWTLIMTAGLAGIAARALYESARRSAPRLAAAAAALAIAGIVFESWSRLDTTSVEPRGVDVWLARQAEDAVVAELPVSVATQPAQDFYVTVHQHATVLGPAGDSFPPPVRRDRAEILSGFPSPAAVAALKRWGVTFLVVSPSEVKEWSAWESALGNASNFELVTEVQGVRVYRLRTSNP
jgi:hypothetical protein